MQVPLVSVTAVAPPGNNRNVPAFTVTDAGDPVHLAHVRDAITVSVWAMMPENGPVLALVPVTYTPPFAS